MRFSTSLFGLGVLFISACQSHQASSTKPLPTIATVSIATETLGSITPGLNHLYFEAWDGPRLPVWVYVPNSVDPSTAPILIMMHGAKRGAARYLSEWDQIADEKGFIIIAPEFSRQDFPGSAGYNLGNRNSRDGNAANPRSKWSFSAIEPVFDHVVQKIGGTQESYTLYGHSAGSQFVHRYLYFHPGSRAKRILAANAGWYTFPTLDLAYPIGLAGLEINDSDLKIILEKDVIVLLGDADNDPNHSSLKRDDGVDVQGPHRFARGQNYFNAAQHEAHRLGASFGWRLRIVEDVAHSNGGIAAASGDLVE